MMFTRAVPKYNKEKQELFVDPEIIEPRFYTINDDDFLTQPFNFKGHVLSLDELCKGAYYNSPSIPADRKKITSFKLSTVFVKVRDRLVAMNFTEIQPVVHPNDPDADKTIVVTGKVYVEEYCVENKCDVQETYLINVKVNLYPAGVRVTCTVDGKTDGIIEPIGFDTEMYYAGNEKSLFEILIPREDGIFLVVNPFVSETDYGCIRGMTVVAANRQKAQAMRPHHRGCPDDASATDWPGRPDQMLVMRLGSPENVEHGVHMVDEIGS